MNTDKGDELTKAISTLSETAGGVAGTFIGLSLIGPGGAILGSAAGVLLSKAFANVGKEIHERFLGPREKDRLRKILDHSLIKLELNIRKGLLIKIEGFLDEDQNGRVVAEEVLEGVLLVGQKSYEEQKLKFIGNLFANICTNEINRPTSNLLIRISESLSYRQFCLLQFLSTNSFEKLTALQEKKLDPSGKYFDDDGLVIEINDLKQKGLLIRPTYSFGYDNNTNPIGLDTVAISELGILFCKLTNLDEIDSNDLMAIDSLLKTHM